MRHCQNCKKDMGLYTTKRKKFCSDACRVQYHRKAKPHELYSDLMTILSKFQNVQKEDKVQAIDSLKAFKHQIDSALQHLGDRDTMARFEMTGKLAPKKISCKECGQGRFSIPLEGDKCSFCGKENWDIRPDLVKGSVQS